MRFEYHKILPTTSHVGFPLKKNLLLQGAITHQTYIGYIERVAFYYRIDWNPLFLGQYTLALVFLYGGHVHLINTKKEWTGLLKRLFEEFQTKEKTLLSKNGMEWLGHTLLYSEKDAIALKNLSFVHARYKETCPTFQKKKIGDSKEKTEKQKAQPKEDSKKRLSRKTRKNQKKKKNWTRKGQWKGPARFFFKKKSLQARKKKLLQNAFKKKKCKKKPILTLHDSGFLPGSISNWNVHVGFSNQYLSIPKPYRGFFSPYKKLKEDFLRLKNQSIGFFSLQKKKKSNPIPKKKPDVIMVLNSGKEYGILFESFRESRPVFGSVNTFTKKEWIDFPLDGNDTNVYSMILWCRWLTCIFQYVQIRRFQKKRFFFKPLYQNPLSFGNDPDAGQSNTFPILKNTL